MLLPPARYVPFANGRYEVKPGLFHFGKDFGNGAADQRVFQIDEMFARYRAAKLTARAERLGKYFQTQRLEPAVEREVVGFFVRRQCLEYPDLFSVERQTLTCQVTGERLQFDEHWQFVGVEAAVPAAGGRIKDSVRDGRRYSRVGRVERTAL